jgi:translocation and assembly module TamB
MAWISLAGIALLLCLLGAALGLLLYHPSGPQWALSLVRSLTPLTLEAGAIEGRLAGPLAVRGLRLEDAGFRLQVDALSLDWRPAALLSGELHLSSLSLEGSRLLLPASETRDSVPADGGFDAVVLPLALRLDQLQLSGVTIERQDADPLQIERVSLVARSSEQTLELQRFSLAMRDLTLSARGRLELSAQLPMELDLEWRYAPPRRTPIEGAGGVNGDLQRLQLSQALKGALEGQLEASLSELTGALGWDAALRLRRSELTGWLEDFPLQLSGELKSRGTLQRVGLEAELNLAQPDYGKAAVSLRGDYAGERFQVERLRVETSSGSRLDGSGHYVVDNELGRFDGELSWQALQWPLQGEPQVRSPQGRLILKGRPGAYDYTLAADLQLPGQPKAKLDATGRGDLQGIGLERLTADFAPGRLQGQGEIAWQPTVDWRLQLKGEGIDPSLWAADFPGSLRLDLATTGGIDEAGVAAEFRIEQLQGRLRGYPFEALGRAELAGEALTLDGVRVNSGPNRIEVDGTLAERLALQWRIDAPELPVLWPGLEGRLAGEGRLDGARQAPRVEAALRGEGLTYERYRAKRLQLTADLSLADGKAFELDLRGAGLQFDKLSWERLDLQASGSLPAHRLSLALVGESAPQIRLRADAGWGEDSLWRGRLGALELTLPGQPQWRLVDATEFSLGAERQRLDSLCLDDKEARLCGRFTHSPTAGWEASLEARRFPLANFRLLLPEGLQLDGHGELQAQLAMDADGQPRGQAQLRLPDGRIGFDLEHEAERLDFAGGSANGRLDASGAEVEIELPLAGLGRMAAQLALPEFDPLALEPAEQPLRGEVKLDLRDLSRLSLILPRLQNPRGVINGDFSLAGSLAQPRLEGAAQLQGGALDIPELGLELREIGLRMTAPGSDRLAMRGGLKSGNGRLQLEGQLELDAEAGFPASLQLTGTELKVANLPVAEMEVTPELTFKRDRKGSQLKGRIEIPYARLRPRKLPSSAVSVTPDLVVVGADEPEQRAFDPRLSTQLRVVMGDRVSFDGFGLRGQLTGSLLVIDEPKRPVIGRGRIGISKGTYQAYGQDLTIERGFVLFADSPVDNPGLDVRAVREIEEVTAGVRVGGTLKSPKIDLFSSPTMGESDILSYLLTGRPAGEGGGGGVGVAAAIKASGAGTVAEELGRQLGLEELRFDAGNGLEEASVVAGTYLSPRLYIQYINELASRETKLRLRYDINRRLQLETETGKTQAGDLYYTFDR